MPPASYPIIISSFVLFWQNIATSLNIGSPSIPIWLKNLMTIVKDFFQIVIYGFDSIPNFDLRAQLVIFSLGIPILLFICVMCMVNPLYTTLFHILDSGAIGVLAYFLMVSSISVWSLTAIVVISICGTWLLTRIIFKIMKLKKSNIAIEESAHDICGFYLEGLVPGAESSNNIDDVNRRLILTSCLSKPVAKKSQWWICSLEIFAGLVALTAALLVSGIFSIPGLDIPSSLSIFLPMALYPFSIILLSLGVLSLTDYMAAILASIKTFCKKWGVRILMIAIEMIYMPILTLLLSHIALTNVSCGTGSYFVVNFDHSNDFDMFQSHSYQCNFCYNNLTIANYTSDLFSSSDKCRSLCSGEKFRRLASDQSLLFFEDVVRITGGPILYVIVFVVIGIPLLWSYIISVNKKWVASTYVYGHTLEEKWDNILGRIETTGVSLFHQYKFNYSYWRVFLLIYRLITIGLSFMAQYYVSWLIFVLPLVHIFMLVITIVFNPFINKICSILDCIFYSLNALFSIIPILLLYGKNVSFTVMLVIFIILLIIPIISTIVIVIMSSKAKKYEDDPTLTPDLTEEELASRMKMFDKQKDRKTYSQSSSKKRSNVNEHRSNQYYYSEYEETEAEPEVKKEGVVFKITPLPEEPADYYTEVYEEEEDVEEEEYSDESTHLNNLDGQKATEKPADKEDEDEEEEDLNMSLGLGEMLNRLIEPFLNADDPDPNGEDDFQFCYEALLPINRFEEFMKNNNSLLEENEKQEKDKWIINKRKLTLRMKEIYNTIEKIIEGRTNQLLANVLELAVIFGAGALGWYIGALSEYYNRGASTCLASQ